MASCEGTPLQGQRTPQSGCIASRMQPIPVADTGTLQHQPLLLRARTLTALLLAAPLANPWCCGPKPTVNRCCSGPLLPAPCAASSTRPRVGCPGPAFLSAAAASTAQPGRTIASCCVAAIRSLVHDMWLLPAAAGECLLLYRAMCAPACWLPHSRSTLAAAAGRLPELAILQPESLAATG